MTNEYIEYIKEVLSPYGLVKSRAMFGGHGIYLDNMIVGLIAFGELYFKGDKETEAFYSKFDTHPFTYEGKAGKPVSMQYWKVPAEVFDSEDLMDQWVATAYQASVRAKK